MGKRIPEKTRALLRERSSGDPDVGCCELCGVRANNAHHRRNQSQQGQDVLSNLILLCGSGTTGCHGWVTNNPAKAKQLGLTIQGTEAVPAHTPVTLYIGAVGREPRTVLLADDGQLIDQEVPFGDVPECGAVWDRYPGRVCTDRPGHSGRHQSACVSWEAS